MYVEYLVLWLSVTGIGIQIEVFADHVCRIAQPEPKTEMLDFFKTHTHIFLYCWLP